MRIQIHSGESYQDQGDRVHRKVESLLIKLHLLVLVKVVIISQQVMAISNAGFKQAVEDYVKAAQ